MPAKAVRGPNTDRWVSLRSTSWLPHPRGGIAPPALAWLVSCSKRPDALGNEQSRALEECAMSIAIRQIGPGFVGEVSGLDLAKPASPEDVAAIEAGMDRYAVLVFHEQKLTDDEQMTF